MYPQQLLPLLATEEQDIKAVGEAAASETKMVGVFTQHLIEDERYEGEMYQLGTAATIARMATAPDGAVHAILQGVGRIKLLGLEQNEPWITGRIQRLNETVERSAGLESLVSSVRESFVRVVTLSETLPQELGAAVSNLGDPSALADFIAANLPIRTEDRYAVLEELNVNKRLAMVLDYLTHEIEVLEVQSQIQADVRGELDKRQREFILREQMKAIQKELGEGDITPELSELKQRLNQASLPEAAQREADRELSRLTSIPSISPEYQVARTYLEWLADLPWETSTEDLLDIIRAEAVLNEDHYGLDKVKRRILDFLAVIKLRGGDTRGPILCFAGPPGTGKTSLGQSIARALGRKFIRMSLGGMRDEAEIRGHRRTYVGSMPGRIIQEIKRCGARNPLFMLDEVDKLGVDFRGDPASALLEVLDPAQNATFTDHYLDVPFDLSRVFFVATANMHGHDPRPAARPHGDHRAPRLHRAREAGDRPPLSPAPATPRERHPGRRSCASPKAPSPRSSAPTPAKQASATSSGSWAASAAASPDASPTAISTRSPSTPGTLTTTWARLASAGSSPQKPTRSASPPASPPL